MNAKKILLSFLFLLLISSIAIAGSKKTVLSESFDSLQSIQNNSGVFNPSSSVFEKGLIGNALHVKNGEFVTYNLSSPENLNEGSIDFYFKIYGDDVFINQGLVNFNANGKNLMAFDNGRLWLELETGGQFQEYSTQNTSIRKWHHAALVWKCGAKKGNFFKVYYDGQEGVWKEKWRGTCNELKFNKPFTIDVGKSFWYGWGEAAFDDLKIYNYAISEKEIKKRAKNIEKDPDLKKLELIYPANGFDFSYWYEGSYVDVQWTAPKDEYNVQLSTTPNFPKEKTVSVKGFFKKEWFENTFTVLMSYSDFARLIEKTKYTGKSFYWRVRTKKTKQTSEARLITIGAKQS